MAIIEFPGSPNPSQPREDEALWSPERPREDEGVLFEDVLALEQAPLPDFTDLEVNIKKTTGLKRLPAMDTSFGTYWGRRVAMSDGLVFPEFIGIAKQARDDATLVHSVPAWFESPSQGALKRENDRLHEAGLHTWTSGVPTNRISSLARTAFNIHASLTEHADDFDHFFTTDELKLRGKSNGAMTETGVMAYAGLFDRSIGDGFLIDPALVQKLSLEDVQKFGRHPEYVAREVYCLLKQAVRLARHPQESVLEYAATIEPSCEYFIGNVLLAKTLFGGDLGLLLAHVPKDQQAHYRLLAHSISNQKRVFKQILRGSSGDAHPDITYDEPMGVHLSIINPRHTQDMIDYLSA